jgi:mycothiol synthase
MDELSWRPPTRADDPSLLALLVAIEAEDRRGEQLSQEELDDEWASVWAHPETDAVYAWDAGALVAFGWLKTVAGTREQHKISCWGGVAPTHRGRGIGRALLDRQVARADEIRAALDPALPSCVEVDAGEHQRDLVRLATTAGFRPERRFLEVARPTASPLAPVAPVPGLELRDWSDELDAPTRLAHIEAFADHWGAEPTTAEAWRQWSTGHRAFRPDLSRVLVDGETGDVAAFVLSAAYPTDWVTGPREAWIQDVGTRPRWRGLGAARWALTEVLHAVAAAPDRFERAILGVDAENPTGALGLYRSLDFEDVRVSVRLVRR